MRRAYSNNGLSWRAVAADYEPAAGEAVFDAEPSTDELAATFPNYTAMSNAARNAEVAVAVQAWLDSTVRAQPYGFNDIVTACTYASSSNPLWSEQGTRCVAWRDEVWAKVFQIQSEVQIGAMQPPATIDAFIALLPPANIPTS